VPSARAETREDPVEAEAVTRFNGHCDNLPHDTDGEKLQTPDRSNSDDRSDVPRVGLMFPVSEVRYLAAPRIGDQ